MQQQRGNDSDEKETDNLDQNITDGVDAGEAVPVPVRNVGPIRAPVFAAGDRTADGYPVTQPT